LGEALLKKIIFALTVTVFILATICFLMNQELKDLKIADNQVVEAAEIKENSEFDTKNQGELSIKIRELTKEIIELKKYNEEYRLANKKIEYEYYNIITAANKLTENKEVQIFIGKSLFKGEAKY